MNPYYDADKLGLELYDIDEDGLYYEYNKLCFWSDGKGRVWTAQDSGCSCPTPFEDYAGATLDEVLAQLERVESGAQANRTIDAWGSASPTEKMAAVAWVEAELAKTERDAEDRGED